MKREKKSDALQILISDTNDLGTDKRVLKTAQTLAQAGYDITLIGRYITGRELPKVTYTLKIFKMWFNSGFKFYAEFNIRLFFYLLLKKATIFWANDLDTLPANFLASRIRRKKIVYDSHELFTEVPELVSHPHVQKIWTTIERFIIPKLKHSITVCDSISDYYYRKYGVRMYVVRNVPECNMPTKTSEIPFVSQKKIILYQGALNVGRGIEQIIDAMPYIDHAVFVIIGTGTIDTELKTKVNTMKLTDKVLFTGRIPYAELTAYTRQASVGISAEQNTGLSYYYALPNKLFDYIQADVPVLVSDLPEMRQIIETYRVGELIESFNPKQLARQIVRMLDDKYTAKYTENMVIAKQTLCWEKESRIILDMLNI